MSVRNYAILWPDRKSVSSTAGGGNQLLSTGAHELDGPEHTGQLPETRISTTETDTGLVLHPDGLGGVEWDVDATGGGGLPWLYAQADGGLVGDGVTDDTVALQALIDTATANGTQSGWIWFEPGVYLIGGALQDTGAFNGQILLPDLSAGGSPGITITFQGPVRPYWHGYPEGDDGEAVLKSTLTGGTGSAAVISGGNMAGINRISVVVRNLRCVAPADPTLTFWNLSRTYEGKRDGVLGTSDGSLTQPTSNAFAYFIRFPASSIGSKQIEDVFAIGFYGGFEVGELSYGYLNAWYCAQGVVLRAAGHLSVLHIETLNCPYHIVVNGGATYTDIIHDVENKGAGQPAWSATVAHLYDPGNLLHGHVRWMATDSGVGPSHAYTITGGANVLSEEVGQPPAGIASFGTPAVSLGTAAAAGAATTAIRTDATLAVFDATTPAAIGAAATGSAGKAARRDHVHATGAGTPSTQAVGDAASTGSGPAAAMTDHKHAITRPSLDDLSDATITSPATGERLRYNGTAWVNSALLWAPVTVLDPASGNYLVLTDTSGNAIMAEV